MAIKMIQNSLGRLPVIGKIRKGEKNGNRPRNKQRQDGKCRKCHKFEKDKGTGFWDGFANNYPIS